jgi:hypothetical protein
MKLNFFKPLALGLSLALAPLAIAQNSTNSINKTAEHTNSFDLAKSEKIDRKRYLEELLTKNNRAELMKRAGMLAKMIYKPSTNEIWNLANSHITNYNQELNYDKNEIIRLEIDSLKSFSENNDRATIFPLNRCFFGSKIPFYIIVSDKIFDDEQIKNEYDLLSVIQHELEHIFDYHTGLSLRYTQIDKVKFKEEEILNNILELRAYHKQLQDIFKNGSEDTNISKAHKARVFSSYCETYLDISKYFQEKAEESEKKFIQAQFKDFKDFVVMRGPKGELGFFYNPQK